MFFSNSSKININIKKYIVYSISSILALLIYNVNALSFADSISAKPLTEFHIKAAFLYKFLHFIDFNKEFADNITIGIIGENPFNSHILNELQTKEYNGKKITVITLDFTTKEFLSEASKCSIVYLSSSLDQKYYDILNSIKDISALTVGDGRNFIEEGGMIGFVLFDKNVRFEVNLKAFEKSDLKITDASILRIATYVIK